MVDSAPELDAAAQAAALQQVLGAKPALDPEELDEFLGKADEVSRLIEELRTGAISPDELDVRAAARQQATVKKQAAKAAALEQAAAKKAPPKLADLDEDKQAELKQKVDDIMTRRARRLAARERFDEYRQKKPLPSSSSAGGGGLAGASTDYAAWDLWTPSDDEDDLISQCTPMNAGFAAMEKDINDRHARMREARQVAERRRVEGNRAFAAGQWAEALKCYELGLEVDKRNSALHANAAMAALKLSCYVQAIERCDSVIHLAQFFTQNVADPLVLKAYQRRAAAHQGLGHLREAVTDLEKADEIFPGDAEVTKQLAVARKNLEEKRKETALQKLAGSSEPDADASSDDAEAARLPLLRAVERGVAQLRTVTQEDEPLDAGGPTAQALATLETYLREDDSARVYFRTCGGIDVIAASLAGVPKDATRAARLVSILSEACFNDHNKEALLKAPGLLPALAAGIGGAAPLATACVQLLDICSAHEPARQRLAKLLAEEGGSRAGQLLSMLPAASPTIQAAALGLLGNCAVEVATKAALRHGGGGTGAVAPSSAAPLFELLVPLLRSPYVVVVRRTAGLLGNLCSDATLRRAFWASSAPAAVALLALLPAPARVAAGAGLEEEDLMASVLAALANSLVDGVGTSNTADSTASMLVREQPRLLALVGHTARPALAARAASVLYRVTKLPGGCEALVETGAIPKLVAALAARQAACGDAAGGLPAPLEALADAVVRLLALLAMAGPGIALRVVQAGAAAALVAILADKSAADGLLGNAALCLSEITKSDAGLAAAVPLDPVPALVAVAHTRRGAAQKNAAIALGRLATDPACLEKLRELHGFEIIAQYVRP